MRDAGPEPLTGEQPAHRIGLTLTDFDDGEAALYEQPRQLGRERTISVKPAFTGEQRLIGLIFANSRPKLDALGNIGRVAENEIELVRDAGGPVAQLELEPSLEAEAPRVGRRVGESASRNVNSDPGRLRPDVESGEQQRAGPDTEIEDSLWTIGAVEMLDRRSDENLRIGTRDQHSGTDVEVDVPESAAAGDVRDRLPPGST